MVRDADEPQKNLLHEVGHIRGITHACKEKPPQALAKRLQAQRSDLVPVRVGGETKADVGKFFTCHTCSAPMQKLDDVGMSFGSCHTKGAIVARAYFSHQPRALIKNRLH